MKRTTTIDKNATAPTGHLPFVVQAVDQLAERAAIESADRYIREQFPAVAALLADADHAREHAEPLMAATIPTLPAFGLPGQELLYAELYSAPEGENMLVSLNSQGNGALFTPEQTADYARKVIAWGRDVEAMAERAAAHNARNAPEEPSIYRHAAAVFVTNKIEAEALKTAAPADTLGDVLEGLPETMPGVFRTMGLDDALAEELRPEVTERLTTIREIHRVRATADAALHEVLDIVLGTVREGADPADVFEHVLGIFAQVRAGKCEAGA